MQTDAPHFDHVDRAAPRRQSPERGAQIDRAGLLLEEQDRQRRDRQARDQRHDDPRRRECRPRRRRDDPRRPHRFRPPGPGSFGDLGQPHAEIVADRDELAARNGDAVEPQVDCAVERGVERIDDPGFIASIRRRSAWLRRHTPRVDTSTSSIRRAASSGLAALSVMRSSDLVGQRVALFSCEGEIEMGVAGGDAAARGLAAWRSTTQSCGIGQAAIEHEHVALGEGGKVAHRQPALTEQRRQRDRMRRRARRRGSRAARGRGRARPRPVPAMSSAVARPPHPGARPPA